MKKRLCLLCILVVLGLTGCTGGSQSTVSNGETASVTSGIDVDQNSMKDFNYDTSDETKDVSDINDFVEKEQSNSGYDSSDNDDNKELDSSNTDIKSKNKLDEKLVYTYDVSYTVYDEGQEKALENIDKSITKYDGFIENSYLDNNQYNITVRIPTKDRDSFVSGLKSGVKIENYSIRKNVDNLSSTYMNYKNAYNVAKENYEAYSRLLEQATELENVVTLTNYVNEARNTMDSLQRQMDNIDTDVAYSTININVSLYNTIEHKEDEEISFLGQLKNAFKDGFGNFVKLVEGIILWVVNNIFMLLALAFIVFIIVTVIKKQQKKNKDKPDRRLDYMQMNYSNSNSNNVNNKNVENKDIKELNETDKKELDK